MSLHIYLVEEELQDGGDEGYPTSYKTVFKCKLSDNLKEIAKRCDVYECLWNRRSLSICYAYELLPLLVRGYSNLFSHNLEGSYYDEFEKLEKFLQRCMRACIKYPHSVVQCFV